MFLGGDGMCSDGAALTSAGRLFHARDAATGKARSPRVDRRVVDTKSVGEVL